MKISKEKLLEIVEQEVDKALDKTLGTGSITTSDRSRDLRQQAKDISSQTGVDSKERAIVQRIEQNLTTLADQGSIKQGSPIFPLLKRLDAMMEKEIEKLKASKNEE